MRYFTSYLKKVTLLRNSRYYYIGGVVLPPPDTASELAGLQKHTKEVC